MTEISSSSPKCEAADTIEADGDGTTLALAEPTWVDGSRARSFHGAALPLDTIGSRSRLRDGDSLLVDDDATSCREEVSDTVTCGSCLSEPGLELELAVGVSSLGMEESERREELVAGGKAGGDTSGMVGSRVVEIALFIVEIGVLIVVFVVDIDGRDVDMSVLVELRIDIGGRAVDMSVSVELCIVEMLSRMVVLCEWLDGQSFSLMVEFMSSLLVGSSSGSGASVGIVGLSLRRRRALLLDVDRN